MQIGFNSDVEQNGIRFHVQTEDHGLEDGRITSQIFREGQIVDTLSVSYAKAVAKLDDADLRDEEIRKRMKALHALCFRNVRGGKYDAKAAAQVARETSGKSDAPTEDGSSSPPKSRKGSAQPADDSEPYTPGTPLPVSGDPRDTAEEEALQGEREHDPTINMQSLPDMPAVTAGNGGSSEPAERDIDVVEEVIVDNVTVESDLISMDSLPVVKLTPPLDEAIALGPKGVRYRRDARAFRGIDTPGDPDLLGLLATFRN